MSDQVRCDSCDKRLYPKETPVTVFVATVANIYHPQEPKQYRFDLCKQCSLGIARAIKPFLPHLAYQIEPNVDVR